jgi:hypothetical protein
MKGILFFIYRIVVPKPVRTILMKRNLRRKILAYFSSLPDTEVSDEQKGVLEYLRKNVITIYPYNFPADYSPDDIKVLFDNEKELRYVLQDGKKLYFKKRWNENRIRQWYCDLMRDQDINSPHRYLTESFTAEGDDVLADIGAAEGNFSLAVIDKVKKIYIFEYDKDWDEALRATFSPWPGKVEIINKYVSDRNDGSHVRFDTFFDEKKDINFLKIDVDGAESVVLNSCERIFGSGFPMKIALCTYHRNNDEKDFAALLKAHGFKVTHSKGYMIHYYDKKIKAPYLRRGLIRAIR